MEFFIIIKRFENRPVGFGLSSWDVLVVETSSLSSLKKILRLKINSISTISYVPSYLPQNQLHFYHYLCTFISTIIYVYFME